MPLHRLYLVVWGTPLETMKSRLTLSFCLFNILAACVGRKGCPRVVPWGVSSCDVCQAPSTWCFWGMEKWDFKRVICIPHSVPAIAFLMGLKQTYGSCIVACSAAGQACQLIESECERGYDSDLWLWEVNSLFWLILIQSLNKASLS